MKISKTIKEGKITSISITFEDSEELGSLDDMIVLSEREMLNYAEYRNKLPYVISTLKKELS